MSNNFIKVSGKMRLMLILKSALLGISTGISAGALYVTISKLAAKTPSVPIALLIGAASAVLLSGILILAAFPTKRRLAKRLDKKLSLGEKAQTMVEFEGQSGEIIDIQREDTERIIAQTPKSRLRDKHWYLHLIAPVIAAALLTLAFVVKQELPEPPPPVVDPEAESDEWALTDEQIAAVRALIRDVEKSKLAEGGKTQITSILEALITELTPVKSKKQMKETVIKAMTDTDTVVDGINSFSSIAGVLKNSANPRVKLLATALGKPAEPISDEQYQGLRRAMATAEAVAELSDFGEAINTVALQITVPKDDALYVAIVDFANAAAALSEKLEAEGLADRDNLLNILFSETEEKIKYALGIQANNRSVCYTVRDRLASIFGIEYSELPESLKYNDEGVSAADGAGDPSQKDDDQIVTGGGKGDGESIYASDDLIYDKDSGKHVQYGEVIDSYNAKKTAALEDPTLPDDLKTAIDKYFADLYYKKDKE